MDRVVILGASRGFGAALVRHISAKRMPVVGFGRKEKALARLKDAHPLFEYRVADFSTHLGQDETLRYLIEADFSKVICVAGGGPYGPFQEQRWENHLWSWNVTFQFPARVIHALLVAKKDAQLILIGSSIAESMADPNAASYCAAKHALKGLFQTVRAENPSWDVRLFSPGYMDTEMLPPNAAIRNHGVYDPAQLAEELWTWSLSADNTGHRVYPRHP